MSQQAAAVAAASTVINGNNTSMTGTPVTSAAQDIGVLMPQQQQQQQQAQMAHPPQQVPMAQQQRVNARMQQPQQQPQQQQGQSMPMHPQAAAQAQMNTLRQQQIAQQAQAAQVAAQAVSQRGSPSKRQRMDTAGNGSATEINQTSSPNIAMSSQQQQQQQQQHPPMPMPQGMMIPNQFGVPQQYAMFAAAQAAQQGQSQQKFNQYMIPNFQGQPQQQMLMHQQMHQQSVHMQHDQQHPPPPPPNVPQHSQTFSNPNDFFHEMPKQNNPGAARVNDTAIKDYEKQLRLMESQNRRRLDVHRNVSDSKDPNSPSNAQFTEYSAMLSQMPPQHAAASIMQQRASPATKASPTTKSPANGAGPPANGKQKKAPRKARKNSSSVPATPLTPANNQPTPQTNIPPTPQNTTPQQTPQSSTVAASQVMAGKKGIKRKNSITTPTIKEDEPFILSSTAGKTTNGSSLNKVQGPVSSSSSHMGSDVPSSAVNDQAASTFLHDFSTASNDIFDFDSLLTADQENAGNLGLTEVFNWGESVGTGDL